jgi:hypothetical protein
VVIGVATDRVGQFFSSLCPMAARLMAHHVDRRISRANGPTPRRIGFANSSALLRHALAPLVAGPTPHACSLPGAAVAVRARPPRCFPGFRAISVRRRGRARASAGVDDSIAPRPPRIGVMRVLPPRATFRYAQGAIVKRRTARPPGRLCVMRGRGRRRRFGP